MNPLTRRRGTFAVFALVALALTGLVFAQIELPRAAQSAPVRPAGGASPPAGGSGNGRFWAENEAAMAKMMAAMAATPSGDVDADFVATMVPHHQGAIEMAQAELRYGRNEPLRRLAQEIIVTQQQEIAVMRLALGQPLPVPELSPDQLGSATSTGAQPGSQPHMGR